MRALLVLLILAVLLALGFVVARDYVRRHPQDVPWTRLSLTDPVGRFTQPKLTALGSDVGQCRALLASAGAADRIAPAVRSTPQCGFDDGMLLGPGSDRDLRFAPAGLVTSCPVAASLLLLERQVIQPAAEQHFGLRVAQI